MPLYVCTSPNLLHMRDVTFRCHDRLRTGTSEVGGVYKVSILCYN